MSHKLSLFQKPLGEINVAAWVLLMGFTVLTLPMCAQSGAPLWVNRFNGPGTTIDHAIAVVADSSGNVFVTGDSSVFGSAQDYTTLAYSNAGAPLWTNRYNGTGNFHDIATALAVDNSGNVFVTGYSWGIGSGYDYATVCYSNGGGPLWTNRYNGPGNFDDIATALVVSSNGNVFVTGYSGGTNTYPYDYDYTTLAYSGAGVPLWTNRYSGPGRSRDQPSALLVDTTGNVLLTGASIGSAGDYDYATVAYSSEGAPLWTNRYAGPGSTNDFATAINVNSSNVFVTGYSADEVLIRYRTYQTNYEYATVAYSLAGVPLWTNRYEGPGSFFVPSRITLDSVGSILLVGDQAIVAYSDAAVPLWTNRFKGNGYALAKDSKGNIFMTGVAPGIYSSDYMTIAYSSAGVPLWTNSYNGSGNADDMSLAVTVDTKGNVFVTGTTYGYSSSYDYTTIKYSPSLPPPVQLDFQMLQTELVLSWTNSDFSLQSSSAIEGTFTNIPYAISPYTNSITLPQQFFRLVSP